MAPLHPTRPQDRLSTGYRADGRFCRSDGVGAILRCVVSAKWAPIGVGTGYPVDNRLQAIDRHTALGFVLQGYPQGVGFSADNLWKSVVAVDKFGRWPSDVREAEGSKFGASKVWS